jgi:hypothetical protein
VDGGISGHVSSAHGRLFENHPWVEVESKDGEHFQSFYADERGYFDARGLEPGRYLVGIGMRAEPDTPEGFYAFCVSHLSSTHSSDDCGCSLSVSNPRSKHIGKLQQRCKPFRGLVSAPDSEERTDGLSPRGDHHFDSGV